jgi:hypothetical protein
MAGYIANFTFTMKFTPFSCQYVQWHNCYHTAVEVLNDFLNYMTILQVLNMAVIPSLKYLLTQCDTKVATIYPGGRTIIRSTEFPS